MNRCLFGDCRDSMRELIADGVRVQTCVTSPPYWGLRDYGHAGQLGLEATPEEYVANMVEVFGLVRDLLADDGTLWLNLGDSYANTGNANPTMNNSTLGKNPGEKGCHRPQPVKQIPTGLKPKDLVGIPWRVAFALQSDGWYLRQDVIWAKPNPMPESVTDRCTKAHEYLFLLSKSERYHFDAAAIAEPSVEFVRTPDRQRVDPSSRKGVSVRMVDGVSQCGVGRTRNRRSVWTVSTTPYAGAHFATFPPKLIEPCILAGSRVGDVVFDPFFGSGTTGMVAERLGRRWLGCELNPEYEPLQRERTAQPSLLGGAA